MFWCKGLCIAMEEYVELWRAMYSHLGLCISVEGHVSRVQIYMCVEGYV